MNVETLKNSVLLLAIMGLFVAALLSNHVLAGKLLISTCILAFACMSYFINKPKVIKI